MRPVSPVAGALTVAALFVTDGRAGACSCASPKATLLSPAGEQPAPVTARVRVLLPTPRAAGATLSLRTPGAPTVAASATSRAMGDVELVELTPTAPLAPDTRYEVLLRTPGEYPSTFVFGTFRTGAERDVKAPRLDALGAVSARANPGAMSSMCQSGDTVISFEGVHVSDPDRDGAGVAVGVWIADPSGRVDTKALPSFLSAPREGHLQVGRSSICDPRAFALPRAPSVTLGVAAVDESGNTSAVRLVRVALPPRQAP